MKALLTQLGAVCPRCDTLNAPGALACASCQSPLAQLEGTPGARVPSVGSMPAAAPAQAAPAQPAPAAAPTGTAGSMPAAGPRLKLVVVRGQVGAGSSFKLTGNACPAGRSKGLLLFPNDPFVAPLHATFFYRDGKLFIKDESAPSGTFVTVAQEQLQPGAFFAVGDTLLRFLGVLPAPAPAAVLHYGAPLPPNPLYLVEEVLEGMRPGRCIARQGPTVAVGQQGCDLALAGDPLVAPRHCELTFSPQGATLRDLATGAGTFVRLPTGAERQLNAGDQIRLGGEVLRVEAA